MSDAVKMTEFEREIVDAARSCLNRAREADTAYDEFDEVVLCATLGDERGHFEFDHFKLRWHACYRREYGHAYSVWVQRADDPETEGGK